MAAEKGRFTMYDWQVGGFGLYLHWPFCQSKCPYCDFNSHVSTGIDPSQWQSAFLSEIARCGEETNGRVLQTVYFGGGTPSLMPDDLVAAIIDTIRSTWATVNDLEITLEANPSSVEATRFKGYRQAGINRVSIGIQALSDPALKALGRLHTRREALQALDLARTTFDRVSFDLIYARQDQTLEDWKQELSEALTYVGDHLSLYQLTIEEGTAFAARAAMGRLMGLPSEDLSVAQYELTQEYCEAAGLPAYEVSNHARSGAESRHNLIYWRGGDYVGIGPGAHGRISLASGRHATEAFRNPTDWLRAVSEHGSGESTRSTLSSEEIALEYLLMSLRTNEGLDISRHERIAGKTLPASSIGHLVDLGLVRKTRGRLQTTPAGRLVLNAVLASLAAE